MAHQKHATNSQKSSKELRKAKELVLLAELKRGVDKAAALQMDRAYKSGAWLTVMPSFMDDTDLSAEEFRDNIRWRLGLTPLCLPTDCNGCGAPFSAEHACQCKIRGLITLRHNILADDWGNLCGKALTPSAVSNEPIIHTGRYLIGRGEGARRAREEATKEATQACIARGEDPAEGGQHEHMYGAPGDDNRGDKGVVEFWKERQMTIFDVRITDVTAKSYRDGTTTANLQKRENLNKKKHLKTCL